MRLSMWHREANTNLLLVSTLVLMVTNVAAGPCSKVNFTQATSNGNSCYYVTGKTATWIEAKRECQTLQSLLAVAKTTTSMDAIRRLVAMTRVEDLWIGAVENKIEAEWDNGMQLAGNIADYPWTDPQLVTANTDTNCVFMNRQGRWDFGLCGAEKATICQYDASNPNCSSGPGSDIITLGRTCYILQYTLVSWFLARSSCLEKGGHMFRPENGTVRERFSRQLGALRTYSGQDLWIGLRKSRWSWVTGDEVTTSFWSRGEPTGGSDCMKVSKSQSGTTSWRSGVCTEALQFVCQKDVPAENNASPTQAPKPPGGKGSQLQGGLLFLLLLLLLFLIGIIIFMICYYRRGRALRREARKKAHEHQRQRQQNNEERDPNVTDFAMFSCQPGVQRQPHGPSAINGHIQGVNEVERSKQNGHGPTHDREALICNNNVSKAQVSNTKSSKKYAQASIDANYDFEVDDPESGRYPPPHASKSSDSEDVFKDINNFEPPISSHREGRSSARKKDAEGTPVHSSRTPSARRDMSVYESADVFAVRSSLKIPLPKTHGTEESLVMESFQADEFEEKGGNNAKEAPEGVDRGDGETERSKYIEDVAKAFDFLVSGEGIAAADMALNKNNDDKEKLLKKRARKDSIRSQSGAKGSVERDQPEAEGQEGAERQVSGEKERTGKPERRGSMSRANAKSERRGSVSGSQPNSERRGSVSGIPVSTERRDSIGGGAYTDSETDKEKRRRHHHKRRSPKEEAAGTDGEFDDERRKRKSHRKDEHDDRRRGRKDKELLSEEEQEERRRRKKERERLKMMEQKTLNLAGTQGDDDRDVGLTRVGSPSPLGKLPPLAPVAAEEGKSKSQRKERHHREREHRKHRKEKHDMTEEEREERRRRHQRKKRERRRKEAAAAAARNPANRIEVQGKPEEEPEISDTSGLSDTDDDGGSFTGTPKLSDRDSSRTRKPTEGSRQVYNLDYKGAGEDYEV